jgi:methionine synthase I (cobalamin-dependent)
MSPRCGTWCAWTSSLPGCFREALEERVILLDGAMGTEIYRQGVFINRSYDEVTLSQPDIVRGIHAAYLRAGADVLTTNTFGANRLRLQPYGLDGQVEDINRSAICPSSRS